MRIARIIFLLPFLLSACAGWEVDPSGSGDFRTPGTNNLTGFQEYESLHFSVKTRTLDHSINVANTAENIYKKIMFDTNLLSFKPKQNYPIVIFKDSFEYHDLTGYPSWSGGGASTQLLGQVLPGERNLKALTSIYTFEDVLSDSLLAHEISHLIFNEYMEFFSPQDADAVRWLNEGFATYEEFQFKSGPERDEYIRVTNSLVKGGGMTIAFMAGFNPFVSSVSNEGTYSWRGQSYVYSNIDLWYWQVREVVRFLIETQGRYNFYLLMDNLKAKKDLPTALSQAYPGKWRSLLELEAEWRQSLQ